MGQNICGARNKFGQPCSRIPAPGARRCYKHEDGLDTLSDEELEALLDWHGEIDHLALVETPTRDQIDRCKALWVLTHAFEVLARQRAGLRVTCAKADAPCGLCNRLDDALNYVEPASIAPVDQKPMVQGDPDDQPEDPFDQSVEVL
jgi:hypothetical protein